jgi:hypothetical protein
MVMCLLAACGGASPGGGDGSTGSACDPAMQTGCGVGGKCTAVCIGTTARLACAPEDGTVDIGQACSGTARCRAGGVCAGIAGAGVACVRFCSTDGDCPTGQCASVRLTLPPCQEPVAVSVCK